jgi:hypothetical protein
MREHDGQCEQRHQGSTDVHLHGSLSEIVVTHLGPGPSSPVWGAASSPSRMVTHGTSSRGYKMFLLWRDSWALMLYVPSRCG